MSAPTFAFKPWHSRTSPLARAACVVYALLLVYSGLTPWSGWRDLGLNPFAYLAAPIPAHVTNFDLAFNVLAYLPFGALLVLALHPAARGLNAVLITTLAGIVLAALVEAGAKLSSHPHLVEPRSGDQLSRCVGGSVDNGAVCVEPDRSRPAG